MADGWDAFISYAHSASERSAVSLQRGLERFARPWHQRRAIRVFRDNNALSTNPALWPSIERGLTSARNLIVLLSPRAAASPYVDREVQWWLDHKGQGSILLVLDEGQLTWDPAQDGFTADSAVPPSLRDAFSEEPRWLDLRWFRESPGGTADPRFAEALADLSAPIRGTERDELIGEDLAQHRKLRRLTKTAVSLLVLLLIASVVASIIAVRQRDDVLRQAVTLRARQLALASSSRLGADLRMAQLLAVQSYRTEPTDATREALWEASFASPSIDRFVTFDAPVTAIATSSDGRLAAAGLADGRVYTFRPATGDSPVLRATAPASVTALRLSADGGVLLVQAGDSVVIADGAGTRPLDLSEPTAGEDAIALSASGRRAALLLEDRRAAISVFDTTSGAALYRRPDPLSPADNEVIIYPQYTQRLAFLSDSTLRLAGNDNRWAELNVTTGKVRNASWVIWTPTSSLFAAGPRLDYLLSAPVFGGAQVTAWPMTKLVDGGGAPLAATVQVGDPLGMAVAPDGGFLLINDSASGLSIATLAPVGEEVEGGATPNGVTTRVPGVSGVTSMEFVSNDRALVAAGSRVAVLQIGGTGRGAPSVPLVPRGVGAVSTYASDARSSNLAVSPDGTRVAVLEKRDAALQIVQVPGRTGGRTLPATPVQSADDFEAVSGPLWLDDDTVLTLDAAPGGVASGLPAGVQHWQLDLPVRTDGEADDREVPLAALVTQSGVLVATSEGVVQTRDRQAALIGSTGTVPPAPNRYDLAAFSVDATHVALVNLAENADEADAGIRPGLRVLEVATGQVVHERQWAPTAAAVTSVTWAGSTVLVAHVDGSIELLREAGRGATDTLTVAGIRSSTGSAQVSPIVVGAEGLIGVPTRAGLQLVHLATLQPSALLDVPPGFETEPRAYAFAPDGHTLITGHFGSTQRTAAVSVRDLAAEAVITSVCATSGGEVTADEWRRVVGDALPDQPGCR